MSCQHGNWPPCDLCDEIDAAYEAGKKSALSQPVPLGVADKYAGMYMALADAMGYDSGKDGMEFSLEEFAAALVQERDALKADNRLLYSGQLDLVNRITEYEQERDALKSHIANLEALLEREFGSGWEDFDAAENRVLKARVAELEGDVARDAARYRWILENSTVDTESWRHDGRDPSSTKQPLDSAIDAAIAAAKDPSHD